MIRRFRESRAGALAFGVAFLLLLALAVCSEAENDTGGSESGNVQREPTQQTTVEGATAPPTTSFPEEQDASQNEGERAQQSSSGEAAAFPQEGQEETSDSGPQPPIRQDSGGEGPGQDAGLASRGQVAL